MKEKPIIEPRPVPPQPQPGDKHDNMLELKLAIFYILVAFSMFGLFLLAAK